MARLVRLQFLVAIALSLIGLRLVHLQLIRGAELRRLAEQNRLRLVPEQAPRGLILDREGRIMASNQTILRVALVPQELKDLEGVVSTVSQIVEQPPERLHREFRHARSLSFIPATIVSRVPKDVALRLEEERWRLPGLLVKPETLRHYPLGPSAAHLLGYLSEPTEEELPILKQYGVRPKHLVGRAGLERALDHVLLGRAGGLLVEVNNRGRQVRVIGHRAPQAGADVALTVDADLQSLIEHAFGAQAGAAVVLDPATGEVLAMVSRPGFNPESFVLGDLREVRRLLQDPASPLLNRATAAYQPGSIVKLITAAAALEAGIITPSTTLVCPGSLTWGDWTTHCWNRDGHGSLALREAIKQSCNIYFLQVARRLGIVRLRTAMEHMGFSRRTGWPLEERAGFLPQRRLTEGEVAMCGIGQGEVLVTPLQAALMAAAFANGGRVVEPWVVRAAGGQPVGHRRSAKRLGWSATTIETVRGGMRAVVADVDGTGHGAWTPRVRIAGKTGTAQTVVPGAPHGWFVGYCPEDKPLAAFAILAEHGGSGGDLPAAIGRTICEYLMVPHTTEAQKRHRDTEES